jgi:ABC-type sugar transport system permease subunit
MLERRCGAEVVGELRARGRLQVVRHFRVAGPQPLLYFLPLVALLLLIFLYPLYYAGWISLYRTRFFKPIRYVGLAHYAQLLHDPQALGSVKHSLVFGLSSLALAVPLGLGLVLVGWFRGVLWPKEPGECGTVEIFPLFA